MREWWRTVKQRRHLERVFCALMYRCAAIRAKACSPARYPDFPADISPPTNLNFRIVLKKIQFFLKTSWNKFHDPIYWKSCDMIAVKREVAAARQVFPWSECQEAGTLPGRETWRQVTVQTIRSVDIQKQPLWKSPKEGYDEPWRSQNARAFKYRTHTGECTVTACRT